MNPIALIVVEAGRSLPPAATTLDNTFAFGAIGLLIILVVWHSRADRK